MKRYVKEIAADYLRSIAGANPYIKMQKRKRVEQILKFYERSMVTDFEVVRMIINLEEIPTEE